MTLLVPVDFDSCISIFCRTIIKADGFCDLTDTPLRLLEDYAENESMVKLSLPKEVFRSILQHLSLPSPYLSTKLARAARSAMVESRSDSGHRLICMLTDDSRSSHVFFYILISLAFLTRNDFTLQYEHALAVTHNLQTSVTSSVMIGHLDSLKFFVPYIKERLDLVQNPSFLVLILGQLDIDYVESMYYDVWVQSADVEAKTGHGGGFIHQDPGDLKQLDLPAITKSVHELASTTAQGERKVKIFLLRLERLAEFDRTIQDARSPDDSLEWDRNVQEMRHHIQWQEDAMRSMLYEFENCAKAATSQMSIVGRQFSNAQKGLGLLTSDA